MNYQWQQNQNKNAGLLICLEKFRLFKTLLKRALLYQLQLTFVDLGNAYSDQGSCHKPMANVTPINQSINL